MDGYGELAIQKYVQVESASQGCMGVVQLSGGVVVNKTSLICASPLSNIEPGGGVGATAKVL